MTIETNSKEFRAKNKAFTKSDDYRKALELAETGRHEQALGYLQEYLSSSPNDAEALNDAGTILHCLDRSDAAINHLVKARDLDPDSAEIIWNLSESYIAAGKATKAMELFDDMERIGILNADVLNRAADVSLNEGNLADALDMLHRSLELSPDQEIIHLIIEIVRHKMAENNCE